MSPRGMVMRLGLAAASAALAVALLFGFQAPDEAAIATRGSTLADASAGAAPAASSNPAAAASSDPTGGTGGSSTQVVDGIVVQTRYGPVQVEITVAAGKIVRVTALELPTGGHSGRISARVEPILASEALAAQSASIDLVSGATYTSSAYAQSLQAALDQAQV